MANKNAKDLILMLKRRQLEQTQLTSDDNTIQGYQGEESLINENELDKSAAFNHQK